MQFATKVFPHPLSFQILAAVTQKPLQLNRKNPFIIGDQEETNAIIGSRVFDMEVVVPDNVDFCSITSKDDAVNAQNTKKQKTMTDYFKYK